ncbi:MAG: 1-deoxy-D-xylulose-5-phosphate synthase, partial [Clostridia bacterium]|nr:1-deoxy-D-xylulose-5-phosphate synthase [Clostridia bacterium]
DICTQNLPVTLCVDRAGVTGPDGETHQGVFDLSFLNFIPNLNIWVPKDADEFGRMVLLSTECAGPVAIRYPHESEYTFHSDTPLESGKWEWLEGGDGDFVILACGERALCEAFEAEKYLEGRGFDVGIVNARFVKPLDTDFLDSLKAKNIITVEDNMLIGGFGSVVDTYFSGSDKCVKNVAYRDEFIPHGSARELMGEFGVSAKEIIDFVLHHEN